MAQSRMMVMDGTLVYTCGELEYTCGALIYVYLWGKQNIGHGISLNDGLKDIYIHW